MVCPIRLSLVPFKLISMVDVPGPETPPVSYNDVVDVSFQLGAIGQKPEELDPIELMAIVSATGRIGISAVGLKAMLENSDGSDVLWLPEKPEPEGISKYLDGRLILDRQSAEITVEGERKLLAPQMYKVFDVLTRHAETYVPREALYAECWGVGMPTDSNALSMVINRLRHKLGPLKWVIVSSGNAGYGYRFTEIQPGEES